MDPGLKGIGMNRNRRGGEHRATWGPWGPQGPWRSTPDWLIATHKANKTSWGLYLSTQCQFVTFGTNPRVLEVLWEGKGKSLVCEALPRYQTDTLSYVSLCKIFLFEKMQKNKTTTKKLMLIREEGRNCKVTTFLILRWENSRIPDLDRLRGMLSPHANGQLGDKEFSYILTWQNYLFPLPNSHWAPPTLAFVSSPWAFQACPAPRILIEHIPLSGNFHILPFYLFQMSAVMPPSQRGVPGHLL